MKPIIIAYVPVIHKGYLNFFNKYSDASIIYLFSNELINDTDYLHKEIRSLDPEQVRSLLSALDLPQKIELLDYKTIEKISKDKTPLIIPREDVVQELVAEKLSDNPTTTDDIFLRWDRKNTTKQFTIDPDVKISTNELEKKFMQEARDQTKKSSDWWRQVGAVLEKDSKVVLACCNKHLPSEHRPYFDGDPRNCFSKGMHVELSTAIHAEAGIISQAAKKGISLEGASLYATTFPCPPCAKLVAESGIKKLYFAEGYGILDGKSILKDAGVELIQVELN